MREDCRSSSKLLGFRVYECATLTPDLFFLKLLLLSLILLYNIKKFFKKSYLLQTIFYNKYFFRNRLFLLRFFINMTKISMIHILKFEIISQNYIQFLIFCQNIHHLFFKTRSNFYNCLKGYFAWYPRGKA